MKSGNVASLELPRAHLKDAFVLSYLHYDCFANFRIYTADNQRDAVEPRPLASRRRTTTIK